MSWLFVLLNIISAILIGIMPSEKYTCKSNQIEEPIRIHEKGTVFPRNQNEVSFARSPSLLFLHLFKNKFYHHKLEKITTTPVTRDCICVPFYLCDGNQTIITDGVGVIDVRSRKCTGDLEVCCYLRITGSTPPVVSPMPIPTALPTIFSTLPPVIFPTGSPIPPVTGFPNLNCICVDISLCDPNGIVAISGESLINPRHGYRLCANVNQVCCRIFANLTSTVTPTVTVPTVSTPPGQTQICFVCGNTVQCITCGITIMPGSGVIDPRLYLTQNGTCSTTNSLTCPGTDTSTNPDLSAISARFGPLKNAGTPQACYCVKTWLCSAGNVMSLDALGIIDPRFTACLSPDEVCCRPTGIDLQAFRISETSAISSKSFIVKESSDFSSVQVTCGMRNNTFAPSQPFPPNSGKTYFAEFPWMVALLVKSTSGPNVFQCGATMINNRAILTAAHCVINQKPENLIARFGQWNLENDTQPLPIQKANISTIASHPSYYNDGLFHDIAVLILETSVAYSANVLPICLPEQNIDFNTGTRCYGIGWGSDSFESEGKYQAELRKVDIPIVDHEDCQTRLRSTRLGQYFQLHGSFICAGGEANKDTCRGDGGGPLACQAATGQFFQAGIVSWGIGCGNSDIPAVYVSVSQHRQWIDQQLATYGV